MKRFPFPDASFDTVVAITVLCFVADAAAAVREMARVLRPGGHLVLGELGRWSVWAMSRRLRAWLGAATWKTARFRTAGELRALLEQSGLCVTTPRGAVFYPPIGLCARTLAPIDPWLGHRTTIGAAFIALSAISIPVPTRSPTPAACDDPNGLPSPRSLRGELREPDYQYGPRDSHRPTRLSRVPADCCSLRSDRASLCRTAGQLAHVPGEGLGAQLQALDHGQVRE